jgi:hypothetical protein
MCGVCEMRGYAASRWRRLGVVPMILAALATLFLPGDRAEAKPAARLVMPLQQQKVATVSADGTMVRLAPASRQVVDAETGESDALDYVEVTVTFPGLAPFAVPLDEYGSDAYGNWVSVGKMAKDAPFASVILEGYSGGAHCCATFRLVTLVAGKPVVLPLEGIDGEPSNRFPRDLDRDGTVDILRQDDSFRYAFASGAGSWSPPQVWNLRGGALVQVDAEPRFAALWRDYAAKSLKQCRNNKYERNGACAAHAAAMARLGKAEEGIAAAVRHAEQSPMFLPESCKVDYVDYQCTEGQEITFSAFEPALRWFLKEQGYIP